LLLRLGFGGAPIGRPTWTPAGAAADAIAQMMLQCDWVPPNVEQSKNAQNSATVAAARSKLIPMVFEYSSTRVRTTKYTCVLSTSFNRYFTGRMASGPLKALDFFRDQGK